MTADVLRPLRWRYATKKFDANRQIPANVWQQLEEALVLSPSSYGLQPWKFYVVQDPKLRSELKAASWNQSQVVDASHLVVFAVKKDVGSTDVQRLMQRIVDVRGVPPTALDGYRNMILGSLGKATAEQVHQWMTRQVFIALGMFLSAAAMLDVDACPMEGFEPETYDRLLGIAADGYASVVLATAGYRAADDPYASQPKVRFAKEELIEYR
jgi:nitroreductase